jgi:hypothetical protein
LIIGGHHFMPNIQFDTERIAGGLRAGLADSHTILRFDNERDWLRQPVCAIVSTALRLVAERQQLAAQTMFIDPQFDFNRAMRHVYLRVGAAEDPDPYIIDASYSQFMSYVGLTPWYDKERDRDSYPEEEVVAFRVSETEDFLEWFSGAAYRFSQTSQPIEGEYGLVYGHGPLSGSSHAELRHHFGKIWNLGTAVDWTASDETMEVAIAVSRYVDDRAIEVD